jgi:transposase InsO family protein
MFIQNQRYRTDEGDTCRIVWIPHWVQTSSGKSFSTRILLAEGSFGRSRFGSKVRKLPKMCKGSEATFVIDSANTTNLVVAKMRPRSARSTSTSAGQLEICRGGGRIFSKWIEVKPLATITSATVQKFFWQNIVCRFGVPKAITVDNGTQFDAETFKDFCDQIGTKIHFASVRHPDSNGLVERANGIIMTGIIKLIFNQPRGKWPDELVKVVWSHNTSISRPTGFTPFKLLFGDEAITPEEAKAGSIRTVASIEDEANYFVAKDTIEGTRLQAVENINKYQAETIKWRDRKVRLKDIKPGHLVLWRVANPDTIGKLQLKWEEPFLVVSSSRPGSYRLKDMDDNDIPRSWNADELRRYYV